METMKQFEFNTEGPRPSETLSQCKSVIAQKNNTSSHKTHLRAIISLDLIPFQIFIFPISCPLSSSCPLKAEKVKVKNVLQ